MVPTHVSREYYSVLFRVSLSISLLAHHWTSLHSVWCPRPRVPVESMCISEASLHFRRPAPTWSMRRGSHRQSNSLRNCLLRYCWLPFLISKPAPVTKLFYKSSSWMMWEEISKCIENLKCTEVSSDHQSLASRGNGGIDVEGWMQNGDVKVRCRIKSALRGTNFSSATPAWLLAFLTFLLVF